LTGNCLIG